MKNISILGSSGSIGQQTLDVIRRYSDQFNVVGLGVNGNTDLLLQQAKEFNPEVVSAGSQENTQSLIGKCDASIYHGSEGLMKLATMDSADTVVVAVVGSIGIESTFSAIQAGKDIAIANKESLVAAGDIIMQKARKNNVPIMPIDSEHSAIFQALHAGNHNEIKNIILTCSGGPFFQKTPDELRDATIEDTLNHPLWNMGRKISVDSATLMNKGLEVIEAHHLFDVPYEKIKVLIHPQGIVHSMVEFVDGSTIAHMAQKDMRVPIVYALSYPDRLELDLPQLDLTQIPLTFYKPDMQTFPCLKLAYEAGIKGGTMPCVMNAANETAVEYFLGGKIKFYDIPYSVKVMMNKHEVNQYPTLFDLLVCDEQTRIKTRESLDRISY